MKLKTKVEGAALAVIALALVLVLRQKFWLPGMDPGAACPFPSITPQSQGAQSARAGAVPAAAPSIPPPGAGAATAQAAAVPQAKFAPPDLDEVRAAVARNPHVTPKVILDFSRVLADRMTAARADEGRARAFFDELRGCTMQTSAAISVRVMCLENAKRLGRVWPGSLGAASDDLLAQSPHNIVSMTRAFDDDDE